MKKNSLSTAIVAGVAGVVGLAGMANAVNVNPDGLGQVLLYSYYTVNGGNSTLISVVNTTERDKAVKVRFLESLNSAEVLDFNLYLSEYDVWTASVVQTADGAAIRTDDNSCTVPNGVGKDWSGGVPGPNSAFLPFEFQSNSPDIVGQSGEIRVVGNLTTISAAERMRQGHLEIIEMGDLFNDGTFAPSTWTTHQASTLRPNNCAALQAAWRTGGRWTTQPGSAVNAPSGGLFGGAVIVDVVFGRALSYNAEAIAGFYTPAGLIDGATNAPGTADLHSAPGDIQPDLRRARTAADGSATARIFTQEGNLVTATFADPATAGIKAVSAALMSRFLMNEFNLETGLAAASEWVITFPTKRPHVHQNVGGDVRPFTDNVNTNAEAPGTTQTPFDLAGSCEIYSFDFWDREESPGAPQAEEPIISPPPPAGTPTFPQLCWESNIIAFNQTLGLNTATAVLGAMPKQGAHGLALVETRLASGPFGWARIEFNDPRTGGFDNYLVSDDVNPVAVVGLPVIGFWAADYTNANILPGVQSNFSQVHKHRVGRAGYLLDATPRPGFGTPLPTGLRSWNEQAAAAPVQ